MDTLDNIIFLLDSKWFIGYDSVRSFTLRISFTYFYVICVSTVWLTDGTKFKDESVNDIEFHSNSFKK